MRRLHIFFILCAFVACTSSSKKGINSPKKETSTNETIKQFEGLPTFDLQKKYPKKEIILQDIADVSYVVLETNVNSLVNSYTITLTDSFIITRNKKNDLLFFDNKGKFLHSFNRTGMSGEEYGDVLCNYCVDTKNKEIFIYDGVRRNFKVYNYRGRYKRTLKEPSNIWFFYDILEYDDNFLIGEDIRYVDSNIMQNSINKSPYYKISKKDGKLTSIPVIVKERIRDGLMVTEGGMSISTSLNISPIARFGSNILIADYSLDTVYTYQNDKLIPIAVRKNNKSDNNIPIIATIDIMTERYLLWNTVVKDIDLKNRRMPDPVVYLYDRFTNEYSQIEIINKDGISATNVQIPPWRLSANYHVVPKNYALQCYPAHLLIELNEQGKLKGELKEIASKLDEEDNPVLIIAKFKE